MGWVSGGDLVWCHWCLTRAAPAGWNYCFVQTVTTFAAFTAPSPPPGGESSGVTVFAPPYSGLDKQFPYRTKDDKSQDGVFSPSPDGTQTYDTPRTPVYQEGASFRYLVATMYYMCEPVVDGQVVGGWVPLASITWSYVMAATWPAGEGSDERLAIVAQHFWAKPDL